MSLGSGLVVAVITARTVLPLAVRLMAKHGHARAVPADCGGLLPLLGWLSGYMVRSPWLLSPNRQGCVWWHLKQQLD